MMKLRWLPRGPAFGKNRWLLAVAWLVVFPLLSLATYGTWWLNQWLFTTAWWPINIVFNCVVFLLSAWWLLLAVISCLIVLTAVAWVCKTLFNTVWSLIKPEGPPAGRSSADH